jgi:hypothetical protein
MDPDATWALVNDEDADRDERDFAALDLLVWLAKGGYFIDVGLRPRANAIERCELRILARMEES